MEAIWFVDINNKAEGPFTIREMKREERITPDTLVWKEGFPAWVHAKDVRELDSLFKDRSSDDEDQDSDEDRDLTSEKNLTDEELVLSFQFDPFFFLFLVFAFVLIVAYVFHLLSSN
jgi:hypothetical protein